MDNEQIATAIKRLEKLREPSRPADVQIAVLVGYEKRPITPIVVSPGSTKPDGRWFDPSGQRILGPPYFTSNIQAALDLLDLIEPSHTSAVSWDENGRGNARDADNLVSAATPAIAICLLALQIKLRKA